MSNTTTPKLEKSQFAYKGFFNVHIDHLQWPTGFQNTYTRLDLRSQAAVVLASTSDKRFVINLEYRHPTGKWLLSCPGGRVDQGEQPLESAKRELLEETGYGGGIWKSLPSTYPLPAVTDQKIFYFFAQDVSFCSPAKTEESELIKTVLKTKQELYEDIKNEECIDGILCTSLFLWQLLYN